MVKYSADLLSDPLIQAVERNYNDSLDIFIHLLSNMLEKNVFMLHPLELLS